MFGYFQGKRGGLDTQGGMELFALGSEIPPGLLHIEEIKRGKIPSIEARMDIADEDPFVGIRVENVFVRNHPFFEHRGDQFQCRLADGRTEPFFFENGPFFWGERKAKG